MKILAGALLILAIQGCMSTRLELSPKWDRNLPPSYEDYMDYYLLGFIGEPVLNLQKICMDQKPHGLQRVKSAEDGVITFFTLGIYAPSTVRVWCGD